MSCDITEELMHLSPRRGSYITSYHLKQFLNHNPIPPLPRTTPQITIKLITPLLKQDHQSFLYLYDQTWGDRNEQ